MVKKFKTLSCILFVISVVAVGIYMLYTQIFRRRLVTIAVNDLTYGLTVIEIYSDGSCRSFMGSYGLKKERILGEKDGIEQPKGKIPKEELKNLLVILDDMQTYDYLYTEPQYGEIWILYKGIEYKTELSAVALMTGMGLEEYEENGHELNEWIVKFNEFFRKFSSFIPKYLVPDP